MTDTPEKDAMDNAAPPKAPDDDATENAASSDASPTVPAPTGDGATPPTQAGPPATTAEPAAPPATTPPPSSASGHGDMKEAPLMEHLVELRTRLVRCLIAVGIGFAASYAFADKLLEILLYPLVAVMPGSSKLIATSLPETFFTVMKLTLVAGAFVASPYIFYQLWRFIAPGLYKQERKIIIPVAVATAVCFVGGALFGYFVVFPFGFKFFMNYASDYITVMPTISAYFSLAVTLLFAFGLIFELPVFIFFMTSLGLVTTKTLRKFRRWAILLSFVVSAILTPTPDAVNQLLMAGPMIVLYEVGIWVSWFVDKSRKEEKARKAAEAAKADDPEATPGGAAAAEAKQAPETAATAEKTAKTDDESKAG